MDRTEQYKRNKTLKKSVEAWWPAGEHTHKVFMEWNGRGKPRVICETHKRRKSEI